MKPSVRADEAFGVPLMAYKRLPIEFVRGEGSWLYNDKGERWLDAISGIAVCGLGHAHPEVARAIAAQAGTLIHTSNVVHIGKQEQLAKRLLPLAGMEGAFFSNSGAEANEAAIKLARLKGAARSIDTPNIIVTSGAFHGRTMATLSASSNRKIQAGFEPLLPGFSRATYGDIEAARDIARRNSNTVAIMLEPLQGDGGVIVPPAGYLKALRALCDEYELLLIIDEVQAGNGRCGRWYCHQHDDIVPDVLTTAKGLGNGVPIGACMARADTAQLFRPGSHASTFGGNHLSCAAALAVIEVIERDKLVAAAEQKGQLLRARIEAGLSGHAGMVEVRGRGLMIGIEMKSSCAHLVEAGLKYGILINTAGIPDNNVIRLLPPLTITEEETAFLADRLCTLIEENV